MEPFAERAKEVPMTRPQRDEEKENKSYHRVNEKEGLITVGKKKGTRSGGGCLSEGGKLFFWKKGRRGTAGTLIGGREKRSIWQKEGRTSTPALA